MPSPFPGINPYRAIYDRAAYDLSIDYTEPAPPPAFTPEELNWIKHEASV